MNITVYRHEEYSKFIVTIENGFDIKTYTLYDMTVAEVGSFIKSITED